MASWSRSTWLISSTPETASASLRIGRAGQRRRCSASRANCFTHATRLTLKSRGQDDEPEARNIVVPQNPPAVDPAGSLEAVRLHETRGPDLGVEARRPP